MPVANNSARFSVIKWRTHMGHRGWPTYEVRVTPTEPSPFYSVIEEDLSREEAFGLLKTLKEEGETNDSS